MSNATTGIEWTESTWSPVRGCSMVSSGCTNCYAQTIARRFSGPGLPYEGLVREDGKWNGVVRVVEKDLDKPLRWRMGRRIFVNPMSDLFHESLSNEQIAAVFGVMAGASWHTFQVLTKRPARMVEWFAWVAENDLDLQSSIGFTPGLVTCNMAALALEAKHHPKGDSGPLHMKHCADPAGPWPLPNVWLGVSVEDQAAADERIPLLLETPAAVHFLSCEPILGALDLSKLLGRGIVCSCEADKHPPDVRCGAGWIRCNPGTRQLRWVIAGGESGPGARPMHPDWARSLRDQCAAANTAFFFKQWGEWLELRDKDQRRRHIGEERVMLSNGNVIGAGWRGKGMLTNEDDGSGAWLGRVGKRAAGRLLDGREHNEMPRGAA